MNYYHDDVDVDTDDHSDAVPPSPSAGAAASAASPDLPFLAYTPMKEILILPPSSLKRRIVASVT